MPKRFLQIETIIIMSIILSPILAESFSDITTKQKRSLLKRELAFLKTEPMSDDLKTFIENHSREKRSKDSHMSAYTYHDGQLVPFDPIHNLARDYREENAQKYTVVPLVLQIKSQQKSQFNEDISPNEDSTHSQWKKAADGLATEKSENAGVSTTAAGATAGGNTTSTSSGESGQNEEEGSGGNKEDTEVLHRILEDVEGLMHMKHEGVKKEGVICNPNGSWVSEAAGMRFDLCYRNTTRKKFRIHVAERTPPNEDGFLCEGNWTLWGELPFQHSGVIIVLAVHEQTKNLGTFIGECRVCEGAESVTGTWLMGRSSRDCKDQKAAHKVLSDVWRREKTHDLQKKHLQEIGVTLKDDG